MIARAAYVAGLRYLADRLERNPDCPLPFVGHAFHPHGSPVAVFVHNDDELQAACDALGGTKVPDCNEGFLVQRALGGLHLEIVPIYGGSDRDATKMDGQPEAVTS